MIVLYLNLNSSERDFLVDLSDLSEFSGRVMNCTYIYYQATIWGLLLFIIHPQSI